MVKLVRIVTHDENPERAAELFAEEKVIAVGWNHKESIAGKNKDEIKQMLIDEGIKNPDWGASQLITFRDEIKVGDIILAYKANNIIALVGEVIGEYEFNTKNKVGKPKQEGGEIDYPNQRKVYWWEKPRNFHRNLLPRELAEMVASRGTIKILDENVDINKLKDILNSIPSDVSHEKILEIANEDEIKKIFDKQYK
ncbi:MAG: hypothetical protein QXI58_08310 [Candidatus Micrarchaeia archaeon]